MSEPREGRGCTRSWWFCRLRYPVGVEQAKDARNCSSLVPLAVCADATIRRPWRRVVTNFENVSTMYYEMG